MSGRDNGRNTPRNGSPSYQTHSYRMSKQYAMKLPCFPTPQQWNDDPLSRGNKTRIQFETIALQHVREASHKFVHHSHAISDDLRPSVRACTHLAGSIALTKILCNPPSQLLFGMILATYPSTRHCMKRKRTTTRAVTANTHKCSGSNMLSPGHSAIMMRTW